MCEGPESERTWSGGRVSPESWSGLGGQLSGVCFAFPAQWAEGEGFHSGECQDPIHVFKYKDHIAAGRRKGSWRLWQWCRCEVMAAQVGM